MCTEVGITEAGTCDTAMYPMIEDEQLVELKIRTHEQYGAEGEYFAGKLKMKK